MLWKAQLNANTHVSLLCCGQEPVPSTRGWARSPTKKCIFHKQLQVKPPKSTLRKWRTRVFPYLASMTLHRAHARFWYQTHSAAAAWAQHTAIPQNILLCSKVVISLILQESTPYWQEDKISTQDFIQNYTPKGKSLFAQNCKEKAFSFVQGS